MKNQFLGFSLLVALTVCLCGNFMGCANSTGASTTCKVTYDGNGSSSGTVPTDDNAYTSGTNVTVLGNTGGLAKSGAAFSGWNTSKDGTGTAYTPGKTFAISASTTLYAQWVVPSASSTAVTEISASAVPASGAQSTPKDLETIASSIKNIDPNDTVVSDLSTSYSSLMSSLGSSSSSSAMVVRVLNKIMPMNAVARDASTSKLSSKIKDVATKINSDVKDFPTKKSIIENIDLSGEALSSYVTLTTAIADGSLSVTTTDGNALDMSKSSNLKSGLAQASINVKINGTNLPAASAIKYFSFETKALGTVSFDTTSGSKLAYAYADCTFLALSYVNVSGSGGKILISAALSKSDTLTALTTDSSSYIPEGMVTVSIYDDSNTQVFTKKWTDMSELEKELFTTPSTASTGTTTSSDTTN